MPRTRRAWILRYTCLQVQHQSTSDDRPPVDYPRSRVRVRQIYRYVLPYVRSYQITNLNIQNASITKRVNGTMPESTRHSDCVISPQKSGPNCQLRWVALSRSAPYVTDIPFIDNTSIGERNLEPEKEHLTAERLRNWPALRRRCSQSRVHRSPVHRFQRRPVQGSVGSCQYVQQDRKMEGTAYWSGNWTAADGLERNQ